MVGWDAHTWGIGTGAWAEGKESAVGESGTSQVPWEPESAVCDTTLLFPPELWSLQVSHWFVA